MMCHVICNLNSPQGKLKHYLFSGFEMIEWWKDIWPVKMLPWEKVQDGGSCEILPWEKVQDRGSCEMWPLERNTRIEGHVRFCLGRRSRIGVHVRPMKHGHSEIDIVLTMCSSYHVSLHAVHSESIQTL